MPNSVQTASPALENILTALEQNLITLRSTVPENYAAEVQPIAERQIVLAGDRLANLLSELF